MSIARRNVSTQSPTVIASTVPPLAAMIMAIRASAIRPVSTPVVEAVQSAVSSANASGSRVRAIAAARFLGAGAVSNQAMLGRITSPQIRTDKPAPYRS